MRKLFFASCWLLIALPSLAQQEITVLDIYRGKFLPQSVEGFNWMNDSRFYTTSTGGMIVKQEVENEDAEPEVLFDAGQQEGQVLFDDYRFSADEQKILLRTNFRKIYRRSYTAEFFVYDLKTQQLSPLSENGRQQYATFSPDGSKVAFTRDNNLYYKDLTSGKEVQITQDGKPNELIHGSTDWVYEEEFAFTKAFWWSPDSRKLAFISFDESEVKEYNMQVWPSGALYPTDYRYKYPKAGEDNAKVSVTIYHLEEQRQIPVDIGQETDIYIPRIIWTQDANLLSVRRMNRLQNQLDILHVNAKTGESAAVLTEKTDTYIDLEYCDDLTYLQDGEHFIHTSEQSGYKHIYLYRLNGELVNQITEGDWEVTELLGIDESGKKPMLYYLSNEDQLLGRGFWQIRLDGKKKKLMRNEKGTHHVTLSKDFQFYVDEFSNTITPTSQTLYRTSNNQRIRQLSDNTAQQELLSAHGCRPKELFDFKTEDGVKLHGYMIKPHNFDKSKKYPVLIHTYGGPGRQMVTDEWAGYYNYIWHQMLAQKGYLIVVVDNRGVPGYGEKFKKATYANLGKLDSRDQIQTAIYLKSLPYVDAERVGIWGWSYGGYMTALCMTLGADHFKAGISVAPVSNWRFYDTIYTERFLQRPQDNPGGYDDYSPVYHAEKLRGKYLLVHGTGDDNVHFQNAIALQNALISANKQFQSFYYPNRDHGIYGGITRVHLYDMMTTFVLENL